MHLLIFDRQESGVTMLVAIDKSARTMYAFPKAILCSTDRQTKGEGEKERKRERSSPSYSLSLSLFRSSHLSIYLPACLPVSFLLSFPISEFDASPVHVIAICAFSVLHCATLSRSELHT